MHTIRQVEAHAAAILHSAKERKQVLHSESYLSTDADFVSDHHKKAHHILHHWAFDSFFGFLILMNLVLVIVETDSVSKTGAAPPWTEVIGWLILVMFVVEMAMRLFVLRWDFWLDGSNIFDFALVAIDSLMNLASVFAGNVFPVSFLRIARLLKLARVSRAFRVFSELRLMIGGLAGSLRAIFWGTILLGFSVMVASIVAVQFIHPLNKNLEEKGEYADCERCGRAYATVSEASLTFVQTVITGDSWGMVSIKIIEEYPASSVFFAYAFMSIGMAILNLILGVVVDAASQARDHLRKEVEDEKLMETLQAHSNLLDICRDMDQDGDGELTEAELWKGYRENDRFRGVLQMMGVTEEDLNVLWTCLDVDRSGGVTYTEFVTSCYRLNSSNTHFTLAYVKYYVTMMKNKICENMEKMEDEILQAEHKLEEEVMAEEEKLKRDFEKQEDLDEKIIEMVGDVENKIGTSPISPLQPSKQANTASPEPRLEVQQVVAEAKELFALLSNEIQTLVESNRKFSTCETKRLPDVRQDLQDPLLGLATPCLLLDSQGVGESADNWQSKMLNVLEEIKQRLDVNSSLRSSPLLSVPSERRLLSWPECCGKGSELKVQKLPGESK